MTDVMICADDGTPTGTMDVDEAHKGDGTLHHAFSIFVFRNQGNELLIQKRSDKKSRFPGYWVNTCCSHKIKGEDLLETASRRLQEELGFTCTLTVGPSFVYKAKDPKSEYTEHEYDTLIIGNLVDVPEFTPNPEEVSEARWITLMDLKNEMDEDPDAFAPWFLPALKALFS